MDDISLYIDYIIVSSFCTPVSSFSLPLHCLNLYDKLYPLSRTFLKIEVPIFRQLNFMNTQCPRHSQMSLAHSFGHIDYGTRFYSYLGAAQTRPRRKAGKAVFCFPCKQDDPCHSVKGCPDAEASSVLSLDSVPAPFAAFRYAPSSFGSFAAAGTGGGFGTFNGYVPVIQN